MAVAQTAGEAKRHPLYDALEATRGGGLELLTKTIAANVLSTGIPGSYLSFGWSLYWNYEEGCFKRNPSFGKTIWLASFNTDSCGGAAAIKARNAGDIDAMGLAIAKSAKAKISRNKLKLIQLHIGEERNNSLSAFEVTSGYVMPEWLLTNFDLAFFGEVSTQVLDRAIEHVSGIPQERLSSDFYDHPFFDDYVRAYETGVLDAEWARQDSSMWNLRKLRYQAHKHGVDEVVRLVAHEGLAAVSQRGLWTAMVRLEELNQILDLDEFKSKGTPIALTRLVEDIIFGRTDLHLETGLHIAASGLARHTYLNCSKVSCQLAKRLMRVGYKPIFVGSELSCRPLDINQAIAAIEMQAYLDETARDEFLETFESGSIRDKLLKLPVLRLTEDGIGFLESSLIPRSGAVAP